MPRGKEKFVFSSSWVLATSISEHPPPPPRLAMSQPSKLAHLPLILTMLQSRLGQKQEELVELMPLNRYGHKNEDSET